MLQKLVTLSVKVLHILTNGVLKFNVYTTFKNASFLLATRNQDRTGGHQKRECCGDINALRQRKGAEGKLQVCTG